MEEKKQKNKVNAKLLALISEETDPQKIALIVSKYNQAEAKEKERQRSRKSFVEALNLKQSRVGADRIEELAFEYAKANSGLFRDWLRSNYAELCKDSQADNKPVSEA